MFSKMEIFICLSGYCALPSGESKGRYAEPAIQLNKVIVMSRNIVSISSSGDLFPLFHVEVLMPPSGKDKYKL